MEDDGAVRAGGFDLLITNDDTSAGDFIKAGEHGEDGRFSAARVADEGDEFALLDIEVKVFNDAEVFAVRIWVFLDEV
ncbi:MAG: hypothetical protein ACJAQT_000380 [Akkermansiaceae bacterium]